MIEYRKNTKYLVKTPTGFKSFTGVRRTTKSSVLEILFKDNTKLQCSLDHRFIIGGEEILAKDLTVGNQLTSDKTIIAITELDNSRFLYDLVGVDDGSLYIADGIVSHNCDFSTSGNTVVSPTIITEYVNKYQRDPIEKTGFDSNLWIWEHPDYSRDYIVSADVARGDGTDYSAFHVIDVETARQVASYRGQLTTKDFGNMLVAIATQYNDALLSIENANVGWAVLQQAIDRGYRNLYYTQRDDALDADRYLLRGSDLTSKSNMVAGFTMSHKVRPLVISRLELYMREFSCEIRDKRLLDELYTFVYHNGRPEAAQGYNDDMVMSFGQGLWVRDTAIKLRQAGMELNRLAISNIRSSTGVYKAATPNNPWEMHTPSGQREDLNWLL